MLTDPFALNMSVPQNIRKQNRSLMDHINGKGIRILSPETVNKAKDVCDARKLHQHSTRFEFGRIRTRMEFWLTVDFDPAWSFVRRTTARCGSI